ncbi:MAG: ABC-type transport auxiliary lipoprotein family protein [Arenicellales bacterium]
MRNRGFFLFGVLFMSLAGCMTEKLPAASIYTLKPDLGAVRPSVNTEQKPTNILMLGSIRSTHAFNSTDILYTDGRYEQNSYAYSQWGDSPTSMLLLIIQQALEKSGHYKAVVPYTSQSQSDLLLESTLIDFSHHVNDDGTSDGILRISFNLIDNRTKRVIASQEFMSSVPASQQNAQGAVAALNKAATFVTRDLIDWLR